MSGSRSILLLLLTLALATPFLNGCCYLGSGQVAVANSPAKSIVVLDFSMAPRVVEDRDCETRQKIYTTKPVETEKDIRGWWFGAQDVYYNENMGRIAGDLFAESLMACQRFAVYRRADLRQYYADKKDILKSKFQLSGDKLNEAILTLNPVAIGREVGVEKVVVGHICDSEMRKNRTFGPWSSATSYTVTVYDVASGNQEFSKEYYDVDSLSSQYAMFEKHAERFAEDLQEHYQGR